MKKTHRHWSFTAFIHTITTAAAHLPCCGTQLFITFFGAQALGAVATETFHKIEFIIPLITTAILTSGFIFLQSRQKKNHCCSLEGKHHHHRHALGHFVLTNLVIGYALVTAMHFFFHHHA